MNLTIKISLLMFGALLIGLSLIGDFTSVGGYANRKPRSWERFDEQLASRTHNITDLIVEAKKRSPDYGSLNDEQKMILLYEVVIDRFTHNAGARHTIFTNWLLYLAGKFASPLGVIWDPDLFVAKGQSLICSQSSYLLVQLALQNGIRARHVGLNGHVVMEAWYDNDWHLFDPDAEVVPKSSGIILSVDRLAQNNELLTKLYPPIKGDFIDIVSSREDNSFASHPIGTYFEWKSQVLFYFEKLAQILKYLIPLLMISFSVFLKSASNKHKPIIDKK